jgi:Family of unknown function (DUF5372)
MAVDDLRDGRCEVGVGIDAVKLARFDQGSDHGPMLSTVIRRGLIMPGVWGKKVSYPFHPLFRQPAIIVADQLHNGSRHLTLRYREGSSFLIPAWMVDCEAASVKIVDVPCISIARLLDLRAFLDSGLASRRGEQWIVDRLRLTERDDAGISRHAYRSSWEVLAGSTPASIRRLQSNVVTQIPG